MMKKVKTFIKELIPYVLMGALGTSLAFNVHFIKDNNTKDVTSMPYHQDIEGSEEGILDATPKLKPSKRVDKNNIDEFYNEF